MTFKRPLSMALAAALAFMLVQLPASSAAAGIAPLDSEEIAVAYGHVTRDYYKKTDPQTILDGAHDTLILMMKHAGVKAPVLARIHAGLDAQGNASAVTRAVDAAAKQSGAKVSSHLLAYAAISGMLGSVHDKYTVFLDPKEYAALNGDLNGGDFGGTGIVIGADDTTKMIDVTNLVPNGPADKAGVKQDDIIVSIDGLTTKGMPIQKASTHLRGKEGTQVVLIVQRNGAIMPPIPITRAKIHQLSVYERMLPNKIGYVQLSVFGSETAVEMATALDRLQRDGAQAIIMDLRENGGGYLTAAVSVSSKFIPAGPIVSVEQRASNITTYEADDTAIPPLPLAVLVNGHTASASEITSGAIQDDGAGTLIGTRTFGKGVVQNVWPMPDGSAVKVTIARYLTPHNHDINHKGITPDIVIDEPAKSVIGDPKRDAQLQRAIDFINDRLAKLSVNTPAPVTGSQP
ncbi:MAG: S41 family peptidase [Candidatus Eremiobacteraeota bacterium]|nr:S41 family peptidase [Candidatus Eremiobacteraeota bacterium]